MTIRLNNVSKRFNFEWILRTINFTFQSGFAYAVIGPNGSGKSTLLQMIAGAIKPSEGSIHYSNSKMEIATDDIFHHISIAAPYIELVEEFNLEEQVIFHQQFKPLTRKLTAADIATIAGLQNDSAKQINKYSSGMKQRLKVALAILSDVPIILLDEPTTNLDQKGFEWYLELIKNFTGDRLVIICSNLEREYGFCKERLDVLNFKV